MPFNLYKLISDKIKNYKSNICQLETNVLNERKNFKDIFEKNIVLEREISERTEELNQANKSLLTLKHIWSTMNSSEPLSEVLFTVVNGLSEELGYLQCVIFQIYNTEDSPPVLKIRATNENSFSRKICDIFQKNNIDTYGIPLSNKDNIIVQAIEAKSIQNAKKFGQLFYGAQDIEEEKIAALNSLFKNKLISILPIVVQEESFGCLVVVSMRNEISDTEKNFLNLFVGQIELAVTIAGLFEKIREQAITDGLTGLFNRRHFDQCLLSEAERSLRLKQPFTLITLDLDHLKFINDTYGHPCGDLAICHIGKILRENARSVDIPARFGGEEFAVILPGIDIEGGMIAAERLKAAIESQPVEVIGRITASIGVATFLRHANSVGELLELVDQAMYRAKRNGRNQVQIACKESETNWQILVLESFLDVLTKQRIHISPSILDGLINQLKTAPVQEKSLPDFLYFVVDLLSKSYDNPLYQRDYITRKIDASVKLAEEIGLQNCDIEKLVMAILLHDLGNMMIPEEILMKSGPLTDSEKKKVLEHPLATAREVLKPIKSANKVIDMVEHYHEHWDGSGYPGMLAGDKIPVESRILFLVDAYFAMISNRPYRTALSHEEALNILKNGANTEWDGELVDIFIKVIQKEEKVS